MTRWLSTTTPFPTAEGFVNNTGRATPREGAAEIAGFSAYQGEGGGRFGGEEPAKEEWGPCAVGGQRGQEAQEVKRSSEGRTAVTGLQLHFQGLFLWVSLPSLKDGPISALISSGPLLKGEWEGKKTNLPFSILCIKCADTRVNPQTLAHLPCGSCGISLFTENTPQFCSVRWPLTCTNGCTTMVPVDCKAWPFSCFGFFPPFLLFTQSPKFTWFEKNHIVGINSSWFCWAG